MLGIHEIDEGALKVCIDPQGKKRPTEFKSAPGSENFVDVHKRVKKCNCGSAMEGKKDEKRGPTGGDL